MEKARELLKKTVTVLIVMTMIMSRLLIVGFAPISYAIDYMRTSNENVEILAYFETTEGEKIVEINEKIDKPLILKVDVVVKNEKGYGGCFDGSIEIANANFKLKDESEIKVHVNAGEIQTIEREIEYLAPKENYDGYLNRETTITATGEYKNSKGTYEIEGTTGVRVNWISEENTSAAISGETLTNKIYQGDKKIVQLLVNSKLENSSYPVKNNHVELELPIELPEEYRNVKVHKRVSTNVDEKLNYETKIDQGKTLTLIDVKDSTDPLVVTYELPNNINLEGLNAKTKLTLYDEKELEANSQIDINNEEKDGSITNKLIEKEEEIYKGKLYTGEKRQYSDATKVYVDYIEAIEKIEVIDNKPVYINDRNNEIEAKIKYDSTIISKKEFDSILGEEGYITVKDQEGNIISNINKDTQVNENGNFEIKYGENVEKITITTSKPVSTGILNIISNKNIIEEKTREELEKIVGIKETVEVNGEKSEKIINLKETQTKVEFNVEETSIEAGTKKEKVKMEVVLLSSTEDQQLFKDPKIQIVFPEQVKKIQALYRMIYKNGLEIKKALIQEQNGRQVLTFDIEGEQTKYLSQIEGGTRIILEVNIEVDENANIGEKNIVLNYENAKTSSKTTGTQEAKINIVEKVIPIVRSGLLRGITNTDSGIKTTLEATVGNDDLENEAIVKAGEVIKYKVTVKNETDAVANGVKVTGLIPNGTSRVEVNKTQGANPITAGVGSNENQSSTGIADDYNYYNNIDGETVIMTKDLNAGESASFEYEVKVTNNFAGNEYNTKNTIKTEYDGRESSFDMDTTLKKGDITLTMLPVLRKSVDEVMKAGNNYTYHLRIENNTNEDINNVVIDLTKEILEINSIRLAQGDNVTVQDNLEQVTIDTLKNGEATKLMINARVPQFNDGTGVATISGVATVNGVTYRSNKVYNNAQSPKYTISLSTEKITNENSENNELTRGEGIKYTIIAKNIGDIASSESLEILGIIPAYLDIQSVKLDEVELSENAYSKSDDGIEIEKELEPNQQTIIEITTKLREDFETQEDITIKSQAKIIEQSLEWKSEEITYIIKANVDKPDEAEIDDDPSANIEDDDIITDTSDDDTTTDTPDDNTGNTDEEPTNNGTTNNNTDNNGTTNNDTQNNGTTNNGTTNNGTENNGTTNNGTTNNGTENGNKDNSNETNKNKTISGIVWLDKNKNGIREENENVLSNIEVNLIKVETNEIVKTETTKNDGTYTFTDVSNGNYIVIFKYNSKIYTTATYQVDGAEKNVNSDATTRTVTIKGEKLTVGATDTLKVENNLSNIDMGLVEVETFDLEIEKTVSKIIVSNSQGTSTYNFDDEDLAKIEIAPKNIKGSTVLIEYKLKVKNTGAISGYAKNIVDYAPSSLKFNEGINKGWYKQGNTLHNETLADKLIKPGEERELKLSLSITMTESNAGLINNIAEIQEATNEKGIKDVDSTPGNNEKNEDDRGSADVIIGIKTGSLISYIILTVTISVIIGAGAYLIVKRTIKREIN